MKNIYLSQVNNTYGRNAFLPYSVGIIQAFAQQNPIINANYNFAGFLYLREDIETVLEKLINPEILGVSCYIWNWEYSMAVVRAVKNKFPNCLVVLGGPHVPVLSDGFFKNHPYADILVHYEGELAFSEILLEALKEKPEYTAIAGLSVKLPNNETFKTPNRDRVSDLSTIPSPYLTGVFDKIINDPYDFHASQETNRGCPYSCTFCDWGSNVMAKLKHFDIDRLVKEIEWFADHKIDLLYNCDANYGILPRDVELTKKMAEIKANTGFPKKFRAAYAKNSNDAVFNIAMILHHAEMNKGITLSFQSMNDKTLTLIKRKNIKIENFSDIIRRYRSEGIATYSEIIIGLPGETYDTFADGLNLLVQSGQHDSIQVYTCEVLPNSEMNHPLYRETHDIKSSHTPVLFFHGTPSEDPHHEFYDMVISTATLPYPDWLKCQRISWAFQAYHCLGLTQSIALYLNSKYKVSFRSFYEKLLDFAENNPKTIIGKTNIRATECFQNLGKGNPWGFVDQQFGDIIWPPEEAGFLMSVIDKKQFYVELFELINNWYPDEALKDVFAYQEAVVWTPFEGAEITIQLNHNVHEYLEAAYYEKEETMIATPIKYLIKSKKTYDDLETYAREVVWYGRKGGRFRHTDITIVDA